jgi:hypothetical protein
MASQDSIEMLDLHAQACLGIKGRHAADWLAAQHIQVPKTPNHWVQHEENHLVLRFGNDEFLLQQIATRNQSQTDAFLEDLKQRLASNLHEITGVYLVPRADACLQLSGNEVDHLLAQVCRLDTQQLLNNQALVMTQFAGVNGILLKASIQPDVYRLWFDISYQAYMEETIMQLVNQPNSIKHFN